ncbi:MAG: MCP four helix bundle domain-containing protein, partial [Candidatus Rokubacteria bacterium]|nr:MCP four helix bundle domain-containing protein [Candidatus Rokubacteria bacterium]
MRWTIARRITLGYAAVLLLLAVVGVVATYALSSIGAGFQEVIRREQFLDDAMEARGDADRAVVSFLRYLVTGEDEFLQEREQRVLEARAGITRLEQLSPDVEDKKAWGEIRELLDGWDAAAKAAIAARRGRRDAEVRRITMERVLPVRDRMQPMIRELILRERARTRDVAAAAVKLADRTQWAVLGIG